LSALSARDFDHLGLVERYRNDRGVLVPIASDNPAAPGTVGLRWSADHLEVGLARREIDELWNRTQDLLARVERGAIPTF
jgi:hypothetical protein